MKKTIFRIIITVLGLFLIFNLSRSIIDLWQKGSFLDSEEERYAKAKLENEQLKQERQRVQSAEFIEEQARDKLSLGKEGEVVVILPPKPDNEAKSMEETKAVELPIWQQWVGYFFNK